MSDKTNFPVSLRHLREARGISQKLAAQQLGISQALLSHYEKGIRECKLEFLVRAAKYYGVTCDYILGAPGEPDTGSEAPKSNPCAAAGGDRINVYAPLYKNLIQKSAWAIFGSMAGVGHKEICRRSGEFLTLSIYMLYSTLTGDDGGNGKFSAAYIDEAAELLDNIRESCAKNPHFGPDWDGGMALNYIVGKRRKDNT